jgi:hypothetical protein
MSELEMKVTLRVVLVGKGRRLTFPCAKRIVGGGTALRQETNHAQEVAGCA